MTAERAVAALAAAARLASFDADTTWYDVLFTRADGREALARPDRPDGALLAALACEYAALEEHFATLSDRAHAAWLERILAIPRLPAVPDRVIAHVTVDPRTAPSVVPRGTLLRGGRDAFGNERRYATLDPLTAHGAALTGMRTLCPGGTGTGLPGIVNQAPRWPLVPSAGPDASHTLRVYSPVLAFDGGDLTVVLTFADSAGTRGLATAVWRCSTRGGGACPTTGGQWEGSTDGMTVTITLSGGCGAPDGEVPWLECIVPADDPVPEDLVFTTVDVTVAGRSPFAPQAAFSNDGALDATKEFQPFGIVAKVGDAFYLRSDEAFGKPLRHLAVTFSPLAVDGAKEPVARRVPSVVWQRRMKGRWWPIGVPGVKFSSVWADVPGGAGSEPFTVGGQEGRYVRALLSAEAEGGWTAYQKDVAEFVTKAVTGEQPAPAMPTPPTPLTVSAVTVSYATVPVRASRVESRSGWRHAVQQGAEPFRPFRRAVSATGATGMAAIGLDLPASAAGSSVSLYFDIDPAAPCGVADPVDAHWEWWDGAGWRGLAVADGSRRLRESGLLRFVAPAGWAEGCADAGAPTGRWIRLVTTAPDRIGTVRGVLTDAVVAEFVSAAADPDTDPSSAAALPPGTIKGTLSPVRGVKKVTNPASVPGRGPETNPAYRARAAARTRHRGRAVLPWDYEQQVVLALPEVAAVRCLPHTGRNGARKAGAVGLVVLPDRPLEPAPRPSVSLTGRITDILAPIRPVGVEVNVLCPLYEPVTIIASIQLRRGVAALTGWESVAAALEAVLHPAGTAPVRWGRPLYASTLTSFLERLPAVDAVTSFRLCDAAGAEVEVVGVDRDRGLYCSSAAHELTCEEQL